MPKNVFFCALNVSIGLRILACFYQTFMVDLCDNSDQTCAAFNKKKTEIRQCFTLHMYGLLWTELNCTPRPPFVDKLKIVDQKLS